MLATGGWLLGIPVGYLLDVFLVWLVKEVVNVEVPLAFPLSNVALALVGTVLLALVITLLPDPASDPLPPRRRTAVRLTRHENFALSENHHRSRRVEIGEGTERDVGKPRCACDARGCSVEYWNDPCKEVRIMTTELVFDFDEYCEGGRELLGGKGLGLAEMTSLGLPVPEGFTVTTEACRETLANGGRLSAELRAEINRHVATLEVRTGTRLGDPNAPLLVSVRSGGAVSMPGMMETVLDIGVNDEVIECAPPSQPAFPTRRLPAADPDVR